VQKPERCGPLALGVGASFGFTQMGNVEIPKNSTLTVKPLYQ